jgi:hypothetical protein
VSGQPRQLIVPPPTPLVYPDNSVLSRLSDPTAALAAEAALVRRIVAACRNGQLRLLSSVVLETEVGSGPPFVQQESRNVLALAVAIVPLEEILRGVRRLNRLRMPATDALHLAAAAVGGARYAASCGNDWLQRAAQVAALLGPTPMIVTPAELIEREAL